MFPYRFGASALSRRSRWVVPVTAILVVASLMTSPPPPASAADPVLPPGATTSPPKQQIGSTDPLPPATTEQSHGAKGTVPVDPVPPTVKMGTPSPSEWHPTGTLPDGRPATGANGFVEGKSVEDVSKRTPYSTEFANSDGSRTRRVFEEVMFVPDPAGGFSPLDLSLKHDPADGRLEPMNSGVPDRGSARE
jgi:hypothetical protein